MRVYCKYLRKNRSTGRIKQ